MAARRGRWHPIGGANLKHSTCAANAEYSASSGQTSIRNVDVRAASGQESLESVVCLHRLRLFGHTARMPDTVPESWSDLSLQGPRRHSRINWMEEITRASSHYMASSSCQWLLSHSNRSFAAGDWPFKMETVHYGHLGYVSMMMMTITYFHISYSIYTHARQEPLCLHYQTAGQR